MSGEGGMIKEGGETPPVRYSQAEVDALVAGKLEGFAGVDVEEYRALKVAKARQEREALEKRGDFEKILAQTVKEKDEVIGLRDKDISVLGISNELGRGYWTSSEYPYSSPGNQGMFVAFDYGVKRSWGCCRRLR